MTANNRPDPQTTRYQEAAEWLFCLQEDSPSNEKIIQWVEWCCADVENRRAFEHLMPVWTGFEPAHADTAAAALRAAEQITGRQFDPALARPAAQRAEMARSRRRTRPLRHRWYAASAAAALIVAVGMLLVWQFRTADTLPPVASFASVVGQIREANLPDGSHINLGARSEVAIDFQGSQRAIDVRNGEAFFKVKHDKSRPFVVTAGFLKVVAVGTAFDVRRSDDRVTVTVQEGVVSVSAGAGNGNSAAEATRVPSGSQIIFEAANPGSPTTRLVNPGSADAWRKGRFEYVNEPLSSVVDTLNRYSPDAIVVQGESIRRLSFTGTIELRSLDEWLLALPSIFPVRVQSVPDHGLIIEARPVQGT